jgi:hypothetical protein
MAMGRQDRFCAFPRTDVRIERQLAPSSTAVAFPRIHDLAHRVLRFLAGGFGIGIHCVARCGNSR